MCASDAANQWTYETSVDFHGLTGKVSETAQHHAKRAPRLLTLGPVLRANVPFRRAAGLAFASDTLSITTMEIVDNTFILIVPGAIAAGLSDALFWWSLGVSLVIAFVAAFPAARDRVRDCAGNLGERRSGVEGAWISEAVTCGVRFAQFSILTTEPVGRTGREAAG
jgi:Domain of unknown function (DUF4396)